MHRGVLLHCLPWLLLIVGLLVALRVLLAFSGGRWHARRLACLHRDEGGAVQSLSFVLTLPFFIMVLMLIVQASQLMVAQVVVEYAAVAAARSAIVWIPAATPLITEGENCISSYAVDGDQTGVNGGTRYVIQPGSPKYQRIASAAIMACAPIAPSRPIAGQQAAPGNLVSAVQNAYAALAPASNNNAAIPGRLANKLAYSQNNTAIKLTFVHKSINVEPPLATWNIPANIDEFYFNEVGWQDSLTVTVFHRLALLPGPGRLLFGQTASPTGQPDQVAGMIQQVGNVYTYTLTAATTLGNEGEKSVFPYAYQP